MSIAPLWNTKIIVSQTEAKAAAACAEFIGDELAKALDRKGPAKFAVSGGNSPRAMFGLLAKRSIDWSRVHIFWVDERCVPPDDAQSNYRMVLESLIAPADIPERNVHRVRTELGPEEAAKAYTFEIERVCGDGVVRKQFDVIHRGIGPDGHTASLFPGDPMVLKTGGTAEAVFAAKFNQWRVTFTPSELTQSLVTAIYAPGADKAEAVKQILEGADDPLTYPAQIASRGGVLETWFLDKGSAALLTEDSLPIPTNRP